MSAVVNSIVFELTSTRTHSETRTYSIGMTECQFGVGRRNENDSIC